MPPQKTAHLFRTNLVFAILYLAFATPYVFFMGGIPAVMQIEGFDPVSIGLFQMVGLPAVIKFLLSPAVDRIRFKKQHYKKWIAATGTGYMAALYLLSTLPLTRHFHGAFITVMVASLLYTIADIPLNALSIKVFAAQDRMAASGFKTSAYFLSGILGSGILLMVYNHLGWRETFCLGASGIGLSLLLLPLIDEHEAQSTGPPASLDTILTFFNRPGMGIWLFILTFYFTFILSIWMFIKPYLLTKGLSTDEVALYVGIYGSSTGFLGGILASLLSKRLSKRRSLIGFAVLMMISILFLIGLETYGLTLWGTLGAITCVCMSMAFSTTLVFSLIMDYSRPASKGVDYAVQSSLTAVFRILSTIGAGFIISGAGYGTLFWVALAGTLVVVCIIYRYYRPN